MIFRTNTGRVNTDSEKFIQKYYAQDEDLFLEMRKKAQEKKCEHMMVAPSETRLLQSLVEVHGSKKIVEIGTLFGYTAISFAKGIGEHGRVWTLEKNPENAEIAQSFINKTLYKNNIEIVTGDAHENLNALSSQGPFDCVFIDADKAGYVDYLLWAEKNLRSGGLIIADNTFLRGTVWGTEAEGYSEKQSSKMLEFHKIFSDQKRFKSTIYPSFDGIAVGIKV